MDRHIQELEAERVELMEGVMSNKRKMQELEANLLHKLTSTQVSLASLFVHFCAFSRGSTMTATNNDDQRHILSNDVVNLAIS